MGLRNPETAIFGWQRTFGRSAFAGTAVITTILFSFRDSGGALLGLFCILQIGEFFGRFLIGVAEQGFEIVQAFEATVEQPCSLNLFDLGEGWDVGEVFLFR